MNTASRSAAQQRRSSPTKGKAFQRDRDLKIAGDQTMRLLPPCGRLGCPRQGIITSGGVYCLACESFAPRLRRSV
jgi:hypothetical protein